ncbi:MAG TPA: 50S ribosomal protein L11 methyltransferase [Pyrinomonadaceae bacterium]|nr:50S ribosomal protein L11 methyltransferase [Pyrinomonadaceae bacterium]
MNSQPAEWYEVRLDVPPELVEAVEFAFNELDSLGSSVDLVPATGSKICSVAGYFPGPITNDVLSNALRASIKIHGHSANTEFQSRQTAIGQQDWLAEWKKHWSPVKTGRFIVAAPWFELESDDEIVVRIDPGMAFGTGTHETTQLCLAAIDSFFVPGRSFLDVGTGTGVLAIAAAMLPGARAAIRAVDNDAEAVAIAADNARLNGVSDRIEFECGTADAVEAAYDMVCANLTADVIIPVLPHLIDRTKEHLVLSGILAEQEEMVRDAIPANMKMWVERRAEWLAFHLTKQAAGS